MKISRQPAGRPTCGQFAHQIREPAGVARDTGTRMIRADYEVNESCPIPQANDLDKLNCVADAVHNGANTREAVAEALNIHPREGAYYADAAGYLGLVDTVPGEPVRTYATTGLGQAMVTAADDDRSEMISQMVLHVPGVEIHDHGGEGALMGFYNLEGLGHTTANRRADTIPAR